MRRIKCNKCKYIGEEKEFPKGLDFFQKQYIAGCPKCDSRQNPGDASMRMFGGQRPFEFVDMTADGSMSALEKTLHRAKEAS